MHVASVFVQPLRHTFSERVQVRLRDLPLDAFELTESDVRKSYDGWLRRGEWREIEIVDAPIAGLEVEVIVEKSRINRIVSTKFCEPLRRRYAPQEEDERRGFGMQRPKTLQRVVEVLSIRRRAVEPILCDEGKRWSLIMSPQCSAVRTRRTSWQRPALQVRS